MLDIRAAERDALLRHFTYELLADDRVAAAVLTGSCARGEADGLSDLDLLVVVHDEHIGEFVPPRLREVERFHRVVWCQEVAGNAPPDGSYLGVGFLGTGYPLSTDWYWQPLSLAEFPSHSLPLVERVPIQPVTEASIGDIVNAGRDRSVPPPTSADFTPSDPVAAKWTFDLSMLWRMLGVAAVKLARGEKEGAEAVCSRLEERLANLAEDPAPHGGSGFERIRSLYAYGESLIDRAGEVGAIIPEDRSWVTDTIDFTEALVREGWRSPRDESTPARPRTAR